MESGDPPHHSDAPVAVVRCNVKTRLNQLSSELLALMVVSVVALLELKKNIIDNNVKSNRHEMHSIR